MRTSPVDLDRSNSIKEQSAQIYDSGRRRYLSWHMDFDTRSFLLALNIDEAWEENVKNLHRQNRDSVKRQLVAEFGEHAADAKIENFIAIGTKPFSVLSYHNALYHQIRQAFVIGAYYPALLAACALGERILNHMILDLRSYFVATSEYKNVHKKKSFADWSVAIDALEAWDILLPEAVTEFRKLMKL